MDFGCWVYRSQQEIDAVCGDGYWKKKGKKGEKEGRKEKGWHAQNSSENVYTRNYSQLLTKTFITYFITHDKSKRDNAASKGRQWERRNHTILRRAGDYEERWLWSRVAVFLTWPLRKGAGRQKLQPPPPPVLGSRPASPARALQ